MTIYDRPAPSWCAPSPAACLALVLAASLGLLLLPERAVTLLRQPTHGMLQPPLLVLASLREQTETALGLVGNLGSGARHVEDLEREVIQLRQRIGQLEAETIWLRSLKPDPSADAEFLQHTARLLQPRLVEARVLGRQSQSVLQRHALLDAGMRAGLASGDLVLDVPAIVDQGIDAGAAKGQLVLAGRRVWGRLMEVQPRISLVRRVSDTGYRDLVRVAQVQGERLSVGPRGMLEGTGEPLCRLRLVPLTAAVAVGQLVVSDGAEGIIEGRFLYGQIERVEQLSGAANWEIWVRPAVSADLPHKVAVLTGEITASSSDNPEAGK
jgi:cell shape-determining protein MreC